ncbi:MAG TPA: Holliday junction branch migration protein RuvA [Burkholderiales bacterium]|nr:Holliday junction branch migration protein RuvA [Burkholderiales bacterium]
MIGRIAGTLVAKHPPQIMVDVHGVGYELDVPMSTLYQLPSTGSEVTLLTHLIVREDAHQLYGFASEGERTLFRKLLKISGVGARTALSVLSGMSVADVKNAVAQQDSGRFTRVPGIGKKTAERLLLELKDKLDIAIVAVPAAAAAASSDVINALLALGYNDKEAQFAVKNLESSVSVTEGIRQALKVLSKA